MKRGTILILILCFSLHLTAQVIYVSSLNGRFFRLNLDNCTYEFVIDIDTEVFDISFHPNGNLYGISGNGNLFQIDTIAGTTNIIHRFEGQIFNSLTIASDGLVYTTGQNGELWSYDLNLDKQFFHGLIGYGATGDLTFYNGNLYAAVTLNRIVQIDIEMPANSEVIIDESETVLNGNPSANIIGIVSFAEDCSDIKSYAVTSDNADIFEINFETNSLNFVCELDIQVGGGASTFEFFASSPIIIQDVYVNHANCGNSNGSILIFAQGGTGDISYSIDGFAFQESGMFENLPSGKYTVRVMDETCTIDTLVAVVQEDCPVHVPNAFTPNGDGANDLFSLVPHPDFSGRFNAIKMYNRWGKTVYENLNINPGTFTWDGTHSGQPLPEGVYVYVIEYSLEDGKSRFLKGSITLIR